MDYPLHPMLVHFPIALFVTSVLFDAVSMRWHRECLREGSLGLLVVGLIGGIGAAIAGDAAEEAAEQAGIAESLIETHETLALITLGIFGILLLWRLFVRNRFSPRSLAIYLGIAVIGLGTLSATGHFGGNLVYKHGAGVHVATIRGPAVTDPDSHY